MDRFDPSRTAPCHSEIQFKDNTDDSICLSRCDTRRGHDPARRRPGREPACRLRSLRMAPPAPVRAARADCAAAPALFYGNKVEPIGEAHRHLAAYLERLKARPSFARVLKEAEPYFGMFPQEG